MSFLRIARSRRKYAGLEVIRAVAALVVVNCHIFEFELVPRVGLLALPGQWATEAVIVFFVLSGTIITLSQEGRLAAPDRGAAVVAYLRARLVRLYPIYLLGLGLGIAAQFQHTGTWMSAGDLLGNLAFLQSIGGYIVPNPPYNPALWSLSNEAVYYLIFAGAFFFPRIGIPWAVVAVVCAAFLSPDRPGGVAGFLVSILSLSLPWILGHWVALKRRSLPAVPLPLGVAFLAIGLAYARVPLTTAYDDPARLTAFAACCCPLLLSIVQDGGPVAARRQYRGWRLAAALPALLGLWLLSPSLPVVRAALAAVALLFALIDLAWIEAALRPLRRLVPVLVYVGSISYALYALHVPLIFFATALLDGLPAWLRLVLFVAATVALSHLMERVLQPRLAAALRQA